MNYIGSKKLETKNLILRPTEEQDLKVLWKILSDIEVSKYYLVGKFNFNWEKEKEWQYKKLKNSKNNNVFQWSIILKSNNECIGQISAQDSYDILGNLQNEEIKDVGWFLNRKYQSIGFGTEAAKAMLDYMFNEVKIKKISTSAAVDNPASWKLMEKLKFKRLSNETHKIKYTFLETPIDCYSYSITKDEYVNI